MCRCMDQLLHSPDQQDATREQIKEQGTTKFVYCDHYPADVLGLVICILSGELATVPWSKITFPRGLDQV